MVFDRVEMERTLGRALELDALEAPTFDTRTVRRLADELGISQDAVTRALGETLGPEPGPLNASAQATIPAPPEEVTAAAASYFRLRGLTTDGSMVWRQDGGWWPDLYRFTAPTPVAVAVADTGGGTIVRLTARLDRVWRAHVIAALLVPVGMVASALAGADLWGLPASFGGAGLGMAGALWTYQARRRSIGRRLARALAEIARPSYRQAPW